MWRPAAEWVGLSDVTFHGLRHSFVAILVAAGCNVREVSEKDRKLVVTDHTNLDGAEGTESKRVATKGRYAFNARHPSRMALWGDHSGARHVLSY